MTGVRLAGPPPERMTGARCRVLELAADGLAWSNSGLAVAAGVSTGVVDGLIDHGTLEIVQLAARPIAAEPEPDHARPVLSAEHAMQVLEQASEQQTESTHVSPFAQSVVARHGFPTTPGWHRFGAPPVQTPERHSYPSEQVAL